MSRSVARRRFFSGLQGFFPFRRGTDIERGEEVVIHPDKNVFLQSSECHRTSPVISPVREHSPASHPPPSDTTVSGDWESGFEESSGAATTDAGASGTDAVLSDGAYAQNSSFSFQIRFLVLFLFINSIDVVFVWFEMLPRYSRHRTWQSYIRCRFS